MEQKKFDPNSLVGFLLIFGILILIMYANKPSEDQIAKDKAKKEAAAKEPQFHTTTQKQIALHASDTIANDSLQMAKLKSTLGGFAYSGTLASAADNFTTIENELITLKISNKGGYIAEATLKNFEKYKKGSGELVQLIKNNNA